MLDKLRFAQVFVNLANNAVKFTPPGGSVSICMEYFKEQDGIQNFSIAVKDTGIGIGREFQNIMYDSFVQEQRDGANDEVGTGLGLAIVKRLVDLMRGTITCDSTLGKGTVFHVAFSGRFIDRQNDLTPVRKKPLNLSALSGKHVLLAEDHPLNVQVAGKLLEKQGVIVQVANNGKVALEMFETSPSGHYDAILMDIRMPQLDGLAAARAIRALDRPDAKAVPIIAMTANAYDEDVEKSREAGMNAHLSKPIEPRLLYETLHQFVEKCESQVDAMS